MNIAIPKPVNEIMLLLNDNNYEAYLVGSTIRNMVMNEKPEKYIIKTNANTEAIMKILSSYNPHLGGLNKSVVTLPNPKFPMEISKYKSIRNTIESELAECDFTMNALAFSDEDGLIDYNTGILDINNRTIRLNGDNEELFEKDPLRVLRAIRLSAEYGMRIASQTQQSMFLYKDDLKKVSPERIRDELNKLLVCPRCEFYIKRYFDIIAVILPELALLEGLEQDPRQHVYDALNHTFVTLKTIDPVLNLRLAALFHDIAKPFTSSSDENGNTHFHNHEQKSSEIARTIMNRLKYSKKQISKVTRLIECHDYPIPNNDIEIKQFISRLGPDNIDDLYKLRRANIYAHNPAYAITDLTKLNNDYIRMKELSKKSILVRLKDIKITGKELLELGVPQEKLGYVLLDIQNKILLGDLKNNKDRIISYVKRNYLEETIKLKVA